VKLDLSRREWLAGAAAVVSSPIAPAQEKPEAEPFRYGLNTSTISGQKLTLVQEIELAARAGYQAIEPWMREIDAHVKNGGTVKDLAKRAADNGLTVESVIDFFEWIVDDDERRKKALEQARRNMDSAQQMGAKRIACPPVGATKQADLNLFKAAERYRALLEIGDKIGIVPQVELWGFSASLSKLGECTLVAMESAHPQACLLLDIYHLYKGGSGFGGLRLLNGTAVHVIHMNDYPADPPRTTVTDAHRVYPGDGVAPFKEIFRTLRAIGFRGTLSLELFNRDYWQRDALVVARTGLDKMRAAVKASLA
jgi:sugar phosphate isomerase/epimerase